MSLTALSQRQKSLIVNNVARAVRNIDELNRTGYKYLYLCSGFIAHYDLYGFIAHYSDRDLKQDILSYAGANEWKNFRPGDQDYEYYKSKADVYRQIIDAIV
jgi:hypothetical protein